MQLLSLLSDIKTGTMFTTKILFQDHGHIEIHFFQVFQTLMKILEFDM